MAKHNSDLMRNFLTAQRAAIITLVEQAYAETGGHYIALSGDARRDQAARDGDEFIVHLRSGGVDWETIRRRVHLAADPSIPTDLVRMSGALGRLFRAFVGEQLADQPELAEWLAARAANITACMQVNLAAAQIDTMLLQLVAAPADGSYKMAA
jgi:hypothetical protein